MSGYAVRVAFRTEGQFVNAYIALQSTMADSVLIGSMRRALLDQHPQLWEDFKATAVKAMTLMVEAQGVTVVGYEEQPAADHERSGHA